MFVDRYQRRLQRGFHLLLSAGLLGATLLTSCIEPRNFETEPVASTPDAGGLSGPATTSAANSGSGAPNQSSSLSASLSGGNSAGPATSSVSSSASTDGSGETDSGVASCEATAQGCSTSNPDAGATGPVGTGLSTAGTGSPSTSAVVVSTGVISTAGTSSTGVSSASPTSTVPAASSSVGSTPPALLASDTTSVNLNLLEVGTTSATTTWKIENRGGSASGVPTLTNNRPSEIVVSSNTCTAALAPGASCNISFGFNPASGGNRSGTLTLAAAQSGSVALAVTAVGGYRVTVTVVGGATGTSVTSSPAGINCGSTCTALMSGSVTLSATTTNGSNMLHTGWSGSNISCKGPARDCLISATQAHSITVRFAPLTQNLVFATSALVALNKGSAAAFDADCNAAATAAGINNSAGTDYIALVSDANSTLRTRLGSTARGWVRRDGAPFADTQASLFTEQKVYNAILFDEFGRPLSRTLAITGATVSGTAHSNRCANWTNNTSAENWRGGTTTGGPEAWLSGSLGGCDSQMGVLCMGKSRTAALTFTPATGRRIWLTKASFLFSGTPDQMCQADRPSGVACTYRHHDANGGVRVRRGSHLRAT
jgi:hypothetical protein